MQYMALIYSAPGSEAGYEGDMMADYMAFNKQASAAGVMVQGDALQPITTASTVRMRDGNAVITDGPFAETKEILGGYYLLECADLDEALKWAGKIPTVKHGSVEVRPILTLEMMQNWG